MDLLSIKYTYIHIQRAIYISCLVYTSYIHAYIHTYIHSGLWYEKGSVLIFVDKQEKCDQLFQDLLKFSYPVRCHVNGYFSLTDY